MRRLVPDLCRKLSPSTFHHLRLGEYGRVVSFFNKKKVRAVLVIFRIAGDFFGQAGLFQVSGQTEGVLNGLTVALTSELLVQQDGSMIVKVPNCSTIIQRSHFNLHPEGPLGPIIKTFEVSSHPFSQITLNNVKSRTWLIQVSLHLNFSIPTISEKKDKFELISE